jgi:hypothetical protein
MGNIWHVVTHPDKSVCLGHIYEEDMTVIEFTPSKVWEKRMWSFLTFLFICHFLTILAFSHTFAFVAAPLINLTFALVVLSAKTPVAIIVHILYSIIINVYAITFRDYYMFCVSTTYIITYSISLKMTGIV